MKLCLPLVVLHFEFESNKVRNGINSNNLLKHSSDRTETQVSLIQIQKGFSSHSLRSTPALASKILIFWGLSDIGNCCYLDSVLQELNLVLTVKK